MTWMGRTLGEYEPLWPAERKIVDEMWTGMVVEISPGLPTENAPQEHRIRSSFLRYLALGGCGAFRPPEKGVRLKGALIDGVGPARAETRGLDLDGCILPGDLVLFWCRFTDPILLNNGKIQSLYLNYSCLNGGLVGDGLEARGAVHLVSVEAKGEVRLVGARVGGDISCCGGAFQWRRNAEGVAHALSLERVEVSGSIFLRRVRVSGEVRLLGARIARDLSCVGGVFRAVQDEAGNRDVAFAGGGMTVGGAFFLRDGAQIEGVLDLSGAEVGEVIDSAESWPAPGCLLLDRFRYGHFTNSPVASASRLERLKRQDPNRWGHDFWPQPYEQLAKVLREMGHGAEARKVLVAKEKAQRAARRRRAGPVLRPILWLKDLMLGMTVLYGRQPMFAFVWIALFFAVGLVVFECAARAGAIKPNAAYVLRSPEWVECSDGGNRVAVGESQLGCYLRQPEARGYPRFNAPIYSADTLLPIVSLEMQAYWIPDEAADFGWWARGYLWFHIVVGWALSLLAVAGFSGLVKSD
jgi:hypothetical protein